MHTNIECKRNLPVNEHFDKVNNDSIVFNYSSIVLTKAMDSLLNKGLNFSILQKKLDMTQVLTDFKKLERSLIWHEFWYGRDDQESERKMPVF